MDPKHFESLYPEDSRLEEVQKLLSYIKSGNSCQVVAAPAVGRSSIMGLLSYNRNVRLKHLGENQKWNHFVYMDFSEVKKRPLYDVTKFMLLSIAYSLSERSKKEEYEVVNQFLKEGLEFNDELVLFQSLKKAIDYLAIEKELTIVLLFDRFEHFLPDVTEQFFLNLRILRNRAKYRFSCVFSVNRPLEDLLEIPTMSEFYEYIEGHMVYLKLYDPVGIQFRFSYTEKVTEKTVPEEAKKQIIDLTGGHGKLARLAHEALLTEEVLPEDIHLYLKNKGSIKTALSELWNFLTPAEQFYLKNLKTSSEGNAYLENIAIVHEGKITIPLFTEFVDELEIANQQTFIYNSEQNEICKGAESISDTLSPSEFRLLRYLILHPDRVSEKEELINAIWSDSKTQEGVTDQALDQIIYRLRKKIEDDPNNPKYLLTIKGRGVRFISEG
jgi:DNA-binding winged helix-turn-helix (wHTH) protein